MSTFDVVVIGAGPGGIKAALTAAERGLSTALIDEQLSLGGQIYRNVDAVDDGIQSILGPDYLHGRTLTAQLQDSTVTHILGASVWQISDDIEIAYLQGGVSRTLRARHLILATGAMERPSPMPGWTLPGVMNAGAAQIMMKTAAAIPSGNVVLVGDGPLLLLVGKQLLDAGASLKGLIQTSPITQVTKAIRHLPKALLAPGYLIKGLLLLAQLRQGRVPFFRTAEAVSILGTDRVDGVSFLRKGVRMELAADTVLLHHGVIPNVQITRMLRLEHHWDLDQKAWRPSCDPYGRSSNSSISICGDGAGIAGALAAEASGTMAGLDACFALGNLAESEREELARRPARAHRRHLRIRPLLDTLYRPPEWLSTPSDETIVCRCEEVTAGQIREMARLGCTGPNQTKFFSRSGMGPCQGRMCGVTVSSILAAENGCSIEETGYYRIRPPLKPIPLLALSQAGMASSAETVSDSHPTEDQPHD